ncbi:MAG: hypothetical protein Q4C47_03830, partial [Planctomycetia bacterium]|nr:hypothetical protein [Planctomycetia bacterium]
IDGVLFRRFCFCGRICEYQYSKRSVGKVVSHEWKSTENDGQKVCAPGTLTHTRGEIWEMARECGGDNGGR